MACRGADHDQDGFTGFKTAAVEELPQAVEVTDPFPVVKLAGTVVENARQGIQQESLGRRSRSKDPLYRARTTLLTGQELLSDRGRSQLEALFADPGHQVVEATWKVYQRMLAAYRASSPRMGKELLRDLIHDLTRGLPREFIEVRSLATTLKKRAPDILAPFDYLGSSNGRTEAVNVRLEHLRRSALGFRNIANYFERFLLESGGFRSVLHP